MGTCDRKAADYRTAMTKPFEMTLRAFTNMSRCVLNSYKAQHHDVGQPSSKKLHQATTPTLRVKRHGAV